MEVCALDNPNTMRREAWQDGKLVASIDAMLLENRGFSGHPDLPFQLNYKSPSGGIWLAGQYYGNLNAIAEGYRPADDQLGPYIGRD